MRFLIALFLVAMVLQPLDLQACAMDADQETLNHEVTHDGGDSECCSRDADEPKSDCEGAAHCAFLSLGFLVIPPPAGALLPAAEHHYDPTDGDRYSGPPVQPLYRPPIA